MGGLLMIGTVSLGRAGINLQPSCCSHTYCHVLLTLTLFSILCMYVYIYRSTLLLCMVTRGSNSNSSHGYGLAIRLRAKKDKGGGVEIATQTLPWGSPQRMGIRAAKPSVNSSSSGELFLKGPTFSSSGDTRARGGVQVSQQPTILYTLLV